jgi:hypothetical protein
MKLKAALLVLTCVLPSGADEGMWLFPQFPKDAVRQKYNFEVTSEFLDNLRLASVRIAGGSGALVSPKGLLLTNQHLVSNCLGERYARDGFYAGSESAEQRCGNLEAAILTNIEDVTKQVKAAAKDGMPAAKALEARTSAISHIEKDCSANPQDACSVVTLFAGSRYHLYRYRRYTDVRLVFAPEYALAFFGRERDSITYLRYGLDIAFLRVYENGKPAETPHYLKWSAEGVKDGDLVFSSGNPATTVRETTAAQLTFYRDTALPAAIARLGPLIQQLTAFAARSDDNQRMAEPVLTSLLGSYKSAAGKLIGLRDDRMVLRKTAFDLKIRHAVENDPKLGAAAAKVWDQVAAAYKAWTPLEKPYQILEGAPTPGSSLFRIARQLARLRDEEDSPPRSKISDAPVAPSVEVLLLTRYLEELKGLKEKDVPIKAILGGDTPQQAAESLVHSSKLLDVAERQRLASNPDAALKSDDAMIRLAMLLDPPARRLRKKREDLIGALETSAAEKIAQYRYLLFGDAEYPDATSTPRLEFGVVKGYTDRAGIPQPYAATFGGLYYRRNSDGPYQVPPRWVNSKPVLNLVTPLDFVSTCDVGGGDAGGPTVNRAGELVGVVFDGNLESLPNTYLYTDDQARAVHVAVQGIAEALAKVYKAKPLLRELGLTALEND